MLALMILSSDMIRDGSFKSIGRVGMLSGRPNSQNNNNHDNNNNNKNNNYHYYAPRNTLV